jgi:rRNA maturation endonuclease Nob1
MDNTYSADAQKQEKASNAKLTPFRPISQPIRPQEVFLSLRCSECNFDLQHGHQEFCPECGIELLWICGCNRTK